MNIFFKRVYSILIFGVSILIMTSLAQAQQALMLKPYKQLSEESKQCVACHKKENPSLYNQWGRSKHFGANVGCYECHQAKQGEPGAIRHEGFHISILVSPKDCGSCHNQEETEFSKSHHASAGKILGSLDNMLADVVEGNKDMNGSSAVAVAGCYQCHGTEVKVLPNGDLDPTTWPNSGIGRLNPDGSTGACSSCHQRHEFSISQARHPATCGKCHLGPDHPQKEVYEESKHGISFAANINRMNMDSSKWIPGEDYDAAPTCATCHMSATNKLPVTHDVGDRISWTLRPEISTKIDAKAKKQGKPVKSWEKRRKDMQAVCQACHTQPTVESFYKQFDGVVDLYNKKFAIPGKKLMTTLKENNMLTDTQFDEEIEWTWFFLWHHEGRRARHGAAMMGPDYTHWHGLFEVAERFYMELIPQYNEYIEKAEKAHNEKAAKALKKVLNDVLESEDHRWFVGKEDPATKASRKKAQAEFKKRYAEQGK